MPFRLTAVYPVRKGGFKHKKVEQSMIFTYCPFCAEKLEPTAESGVA